MNVFNRLLVIAAVLFAIALMPVAIAALLFFRTPVSNSLDSLSRTLNDGPSGVLFQTVCIGLALCVFLIALLVLFLELRRSSVRRLRVHQVTDGTVEVTDDAITQRLEHNISQIPDVIGVKPRVAASKKNTVDAFIELETNPEVNVPEKTQQVIATARQVMEQQMGLQVGKIRVQLAYSRKKTQVQSS